MRKYILLVLVILSTTQPHDDWTKTARIADVDFWPDFTAEEIEEGIDNAHEQGISVVIAWVSSENIDIPQEDLDALRKASSYMHEQYPDMKLVVYQAPLEIITENVDTNRDGSIDPGQHSIYTDHPEWLQVGMDGRKAVFYGGFEFWIGNTDEDVWLCPNDPVYREKVRESIQGLAETGVDGIWFDVVRFLCNFGDWDENWACHCEDCQQKFLNDTGLTIPTKKTWDATWKTWVLWRQQCIEEYIEELSETAKEVNPEMKIIVEHWHGFDAESTQDAWSPIGLQSVTDVLAHEYVSASEYVETYTPANYVRDIALYTFYRGSDRSHPSWILVYSQEEHGQRMLAASVLQAGCNYYDTVVPDMVDSVSLKERTRIFQWLKQHAEYYYDVEPVSTVAVYYSKTTIDFYDCPAEDWMFYREFVGVSMMLLSLHIPYSVITDLDCAEQFDTLILPDIACLSDEEEILLKEFMEGGGHIISTGETGYYDEMGQQRSSTELSEHPLMHSTDRFFGNEYYEEVNPFFYPDEAEDQGTGDMVKREFLSFLNQTPFLQVETTASDHVVVLPFIRGNTIVFRIINFEGISPGDAVPDPHTVSVTSTRDILKAALIPFLSIREQAEYSDSAVSVQIKDHCLLLVEVEPVSIFCNEYDLPAAESLASFLQQRGIPVQFVASHEDASSVLIVLGGHRAEKTGEFVSRLLTDEQKDQLEKSKAKELFIFQTDKLIIVIAGNEREDTAALSWETRRDIFALV